MWISKRDLIGKERELASLTTDVKLKQSQILRLEKEVDYWREKFEQEKNRADRVNDKLTETAGFGPVSELGIGEAEKLRKEYERMMKQSQRESAEMFADDIPGEGLEIDESLGEELLKGFGK